LLPWNTAVVVTMECERGGGGGGWGNLDVVWRTRCSV